MRERIETLMAEIAALDCKTEQEIEEARVRLLGKKGSVTALFEEFRSVAPELKREFGQKLNVLKNTAAAKIEELKEAAAESPATTAAAFDYTMPGDPVALGSRHPVSIAREEIVGIFRKFGYDVAEGPEVEDDWHVFEALNFPPEHPAREMQDTFFINDSDNPVPTLHLFRYVQWRRCRFLSVLSALVVCSVTRLSLLVHTVSSIRLRVFTSMRM